MPRSSRRPWLPAEREQTVLVTQMNKNKKFQKEQLGKEGYTEFREFYKEELKR